MHDALVDGDETSVRRIASRLLEEGTPIIDLIEGVIVPPLREIGTAWHNGEGAPLATAATIVGH